MKKVLLVVLRLYQRWLSPALPAACRYVPSCSQYACDALEHHGVVRGTALALWRVLRCHPFARGGHDPAPTPDSRLLTPELHHSHGKQV